MCWVITSCNFYSISRSLLCFRTLFIKKTNIYKYGCNFYTILVLQAHMLFHVLHITLHPYYYLKKN